MGGGDTFFGKCSYFVITGKPPKEIPKEVIDVGCRFWKSKPNKKDISRMDFVCNADRSKSQIGLGLTGVENDTDS